MRLLKIEAILLSLPLQPLTDYGWLTVVAIIAVVLLIIFVAYSYVFKKKAKDYKRLEKIRENSQQETKEEQDEARK